MAPREGAVVIPVDGSAWCTRCGWQPPDSETRARRRLMARAHALDPAECERYAARQRAASMARHPTARRDYSDSPWPP